MPIDFPDGSDACDSYGYTYDSNCTADGGTLGYDQNFISTELPDGTKAWVPLNGVLAGTEGSPGNQGPTGDDASPTGPQGPMGPTGNPAAVEGGTGDTGDAGPAGSDGVTFPAQNQTGTDVELSYRFNISFAEPYTAKRFKSNVDLDYGGLERVAPKTNRFAQFHLQSGRIDLTRNTSKRGPFQTFSIPSGAGQDRMPLGTWTLLKSAAGTSFATTPAGSEFEETKFVFPNVSGVYWPSFEIESNPALLGPNPNSPLLPQYVGAPWTSYTSINFGDYPTDEEFNIIHPLRHIYADDVYFFSLFRREKELPANAWFSRGARSSLGFGGNFDFYYIRDLVETVDRFKEVVEVTTTSGENSGIDIKSITDIGSTSDSPMMGRVIEFPYVDVFREFQGAVPSATGGIWGEVPFNPYPTTNHPYGTLPLPGDPVNIVDKGKREYSNIISNTGALSRIRELNMQWAKEELGESEFSTELGQFNHNPFNYAPLNTSTSEGTGDDAISWKTVFGGRMPYMFYFGGPCIPADGNPASGFSAAERWASTKGSDNKTAIYIQEKFNTNAMTGGSFHPPTGSSGPWPLRQSMHFNGYKYSNAGATMIDKIVFLTGTTFGSGNELALGTGGSVTLTFSQWNQETNDGGPTYGFGHLFEFVAGTCADTDPKVSSTDSSKVKFLGGETHPLGTSIGDTDIFHIFCTGLASGTAGYLISHQQYHS